MMRRGMDINEDSVSHQVASDSANTDGLTDECARKKHILKVKMV